VSNHAAPGEECRHNLLYWRYGEYAGIGPGAHGRVVVGAARQAISAERLPERWLGQVEASGHGIAETTPLSREETADEALIMGLRLSEGIDLDRLAAASGYAPAPRAIDTLVGDGLIERHGNCRVRPTAAGRLVINRIVLQLASALEPAAAIS
jgi:oxygen-independent coproporphyrinogen-3 oxidase